MSFRNKRVTDFESKDCSGCALCVACCKSVIIARSLNENQTYGSTECKTNLNGESENRIAGTLHSLACLILIIIHAVGGHNHRHKSYRTELQADKEKAETEFEKYRIIQDRLFVSDFDKYLLELEEHDNKK